MFKKSKIITGNINFYHYLINIRKIPLSEFNSLPVYWQNLLLMQYEEYCQRCKK